MKQDNETANLDILEGRNSVLEAIKSGRPINKILISKGDREGSINKIIGLANEKGIIIQEVDRKKLDSVSLTRSHQGVIAYVSAKEYVELEDILDNAKARNEDPFIVILDEITDIHNLGAIIRTADAFGVHGVVIPNRRSASLNSVVSKISAGALEYVPVARVNNLTSAIEYFKSCGIWVVGADINSKLIAQKSNLTGPLALVIGNEEKGIRRLIKEKCDFLVKIPMVGKISSLNASVAGAIMIYEAFIQRNK